MNLRKSVHISTDFFNCESSCDLPDNPSPIYDRKTASRRFDTTHIIIRSLSLLQSLLKGRNAQIWRQREPTFWEQAGLRHLYFTKKKIKV